MPALKSSQPPTSASLLDFGWWTDLQRFLPVNAKVLGCFAYDTCQRVWGLEGCFEAIFILLWNSSSPGSRNSVLSIFKACSAPEQVWGWAGADIPRDWRIPTSCLWSLLLLGRAVEPCAIGRYWASWSPCHVPFILNKCSYSISSKAGGKWSSLRHNVKYSKQV